MKEPMKEPKWELSLEYGEGINGAMDIDASVPGDEMAVADLCNKRVAIYDTKGHQKKSIPLSSSKFHTNHLVRGILL